MDINSETFIQIVLRNAEYLSLICSMMMTRMLWLRILAILSGTIGIFYTYMWLQDPMGLAWEVAFTGTNVVQLALIEYQNMIARFNDDERAFYIQVVPTLQPAQMRRLLRIGSWMDAEPGEILIHQGEIVSHLMYLRSGEADVLVDGREVGKCVQGNLIGEISISTGAPASASVVAKGGVRYFAMERRNLHRLLASDPDIALIVDCGYRRNLEDKLMRMNAMPLPTT